MKGIFIRGALTEEDQVELAERIASFILKRSAQLSPEYGSEYALAAAIAECIVGMEPPTEVSDPLN